jgi:hypothetical protein
MMSPVYDSRFNPIVDQTANSRSCRRLADSPSFPRPRLQSNHVNDAAYVFVPIPEFWILDFAVGFVKPTVSARH